MTDTEKQELKVILGQLRHLYLNIFHGYVRGHEQLADGLLSPQIKKLERLIKD